MSQSLFFFFKQKTAYERRISDWISDVCSSDLLEARQRKLDDDLKKASALKDEAASILAEYEKMRATAQASAHAALQKAQAEMKAEAERQGHAVAAKLGQQTEEAETRIAAAKSAALAGLASTVKEVVAAATEKLHGVQAERTSVGEGRRGDVRV